MKFKLNLKTIPRYPDILRSQANTQKIRASIAQLWSQPQRDSIGSLKERILEYVPFDGFVLAETNLIPESVGKYIFSCYFNSK